MAVFYAFANQSREGDKAEYLIATDYQVDWLDRETPAPSECIWFVPGFPPIEL